MTTRDQAVLVIRKYWQYVGAGDADAVGSLLADDVVRIGPYADEGESDICRGKQAYCDFLRVILKRQTRYRNEITDVLASDDGRRAYALGTEFLELDGVDHVFPLCAAIEINADGLIAKLDFYWKTTKSSARSIVVDRHVER